MTNVLSALDASCSSPASLVPLDLSPVLQYSDAATSSFLLSPLCAAASLRSPLVADPFLKSPLFSALPISPLSSPTSALAFLQSPFHPLKQVQKVAPRAAAEYTSSPISLPTADSPMTDEPRSPSATTATNVTPRPSPSLTDPYAVTNENESIATTITTTAIASSPASTAERVAVAAPSPSSNKPLKATSAIDKAAERRRKNRESSSRCYYNRKRIIQKLEAQLVAEKDKLTMMYDRALQLRHDNARLKKEVVTNGYALPSSRSKHASSKSTNSFSLRDYLRLLHSSTYQNPSHALL